MNKVELLSPIIVSTIKSCDDITVLGTRDSIINIYDELLKEGIKVQDTFCSSPNYPFNLESSKLLYLSKIGETYIMESALVDNTKDLIPIDAGQIMIEPILKWYKPYDYLIGQLDKIKGDEIEWI